MKGLVKTAVVSLQFILAVSLLAIVYGLVTRRAFTLAYVFTANFVVGAAIICLALVTMILPAGFKLDKLTDHTTFAERYYLERHREKQKKAFGFLSLGLLVVVITGLVQLFLAWVIPAA